MKDFMHADRDGVLQATAGSYTVRRTAFSLAFRCPLPLPFTVFPLPFLGLPPPLPLPFRVFFTSSHCPATAIRSSSASRRRRTLAWASRPPPSMRAELSSESSTRPPAQDRSSSSCTNVAQDTAGFESKNQQRGKQQRGGNDSDIRTRSCKRSRIRSPFTAVGSSSRSLVAVFFLRGSPRLV